MIKEVESVVEGVVVVASRRGKVDVLVNKKDLSKVERSQIEDIV